MSPAYFHHDLAYARQGALSGRYEQTQAILQDVTALFDHEISFQFLRRDGFCPITGKEQGVVNV